MKTISKKSLIKIFTLSLFTIHYSLFTIPVRADDCLAYKLSPDVNVFAPVWEKYVVQPGQPMNLLHGNVVAAFSENYELLGDTTRSGDGFCISLRGVNASIGYAEFIVKIDKSHVPGSCSYNKVLSHEDEHIRTYLRVAEDFKSELISAVKSASNSVVPIFASDDTGIESAIDNFNSQLQNHPDVILIKQKISAQQELRNKRIDENTKPTNLSECYL